MNEIRRRISTGAMGLVMLLAVLGARAMAGDAPAKAPLGKYFGQYRELDITEITPTGWLADLLNRQRDGLGLNVKYSGYPFDTCMWTGTIPSSPTKGDEPAAWDSYEQTAYYIDGAYRCGLLLKDPALEKVGQDNVSYVLAHPQPNGLLSPAAMTPISANLIGGGKDSKPKTASQWPFVVFTRALIAHYMATHDPKLLTGLTAHYLALPADFGVAPRDVDNIEGMCWLYGQTGDQRMLDLAERTYQNFVPTNKQWSLDRLVKDGVKHGHGVSVSEATKQPTILYLYTGKKEYLDAASHAFDQLHREDELVDGVLTSDAGLSGKQPDHEHETCVVSDYSWSVGYLLQADGDAKWADTVERCVLNAGLGVIDKNFHSLQYYGSPNQVVATNDSMTPQTGTLKREMQSYRPDFSIQCCAGNVHRMVPNYAARMFLSDGKGGVVAALYGPATLKTHAGAKADAVTIDEQTSYPFAGSIDFKITADKPTAFPLSLRIPGWAAGAVITVNGKPIADALTPDTFVKISRTFATGDVVHIELPMNVRIETPVDNGQSVFRGPLLFALKVGVDAKVSDKRMKNTVERDPAFPAWDLTSASAWNYSLALSGPADASKIKVDVKPINGFPWDLASVPITMTVAAHKVNGWTLKAPDNTNPALPAPPLQLAADTEPVTLVPYGATQLRVSVFPTEPSLK